VADIALHVLLFLFLAAFLAGFIDSIAGGGGMITIPAMLIAGIPPLETLGTNKLQSLFGSGSATLAYARAGHVRLNEQLPMAALSALGAVFGALLATIFAVCTMFGAIASFRSAVIAPSAFTSRARIGLRSRV